MGRKYSREKAKREHMRAILRLHWVAVAYLERGLSSSLISLKRKAEIAPSRAVMEGLCDHSHHWTFIAVAVCEKADGERYIKTHGFTTTTIHRSDALKDAVKEYVLALKDAENPSHYKWGAWIATPYPCDIPDAKVFDILESMGAWEKGEVAA